MYNKLLKKYYLSKNFTLALPKNKNINQASFYLCKYLIKNTPYANLNNFIKEIAKLLPILTFNKKYFLFIGSNNLYLYNFQKNTNFNIIKSKKFHFLQNKNLPFSKI